MHRLPRVAAATVLSAAVVGGLVVTAPAASAAAPPAASAIGYRAGDGRVALSWTDPTASTDFARVRLVYAAGRTPAAVGDGTEVPLASPAATSAVVTGLADGQAYTFVLFTCDADGNATPSAPVTATPHAPAAGHFAIALRRSSIGTGLGTSSTVLSGTYTDAAGHAVRGLRVRVLREYGGTSTWTVVSTLTTGAGGHLAMTAHPTRTAYYRFALPASPYDAATRSSAVKLRYVPRISLATPSLARTYTPFTVSGWVKPAMAGQQVVLRRYYGGAWHTAARTTTGAYGGYRFSLTATSTASRVLRAVYVATAAHAGDVSGDHTVRVTPRDLQAGMSGPDVFALQKRLAALHYDVGTIDGRFGFDTTHAVVPFQKLNGLPRTGVVDATTLGRLSDPATPHRRHLVPGHSVEVDKTHQIAAFYSDGALYRIVDVSTGSGKTYWQDGVENVATTPVGSFAVNRKIDGMRVSALGELWKPSYFYEGYAIHGNGSVPPYPASHGCVRITNPAVDRYFGWLTIGTRVYVFD